MQSFHSSTFRLLGIEPRLSPSAVAEVEQTERRLGFRLPASVRDWYCCCDPIRILADHSNQDHPIPVHKFDVTQWKSYRLLPFQIENQGVCIWSIALDGSDDPPVFVDVDSNGADWHMLAPAFSIYVYACVWDYEIVLGQRALAQGQNKPLSSKAIESLRQSFTEQPTTYGWPGSEQYRFAENQADWFVGACSESSLESALKAVWNVDEVGASFYDCSDLAATVLARIRGK